MPALISATARRSRPVLSDHAARALLHLARQLHDDTNPDTADSLIRSACRVVHITPTEAAAQAFRTFAVLQQEWDARVLQVTTWNAPPLPEDARPSADILNEAIDALNAFRDCMDGE